MVHVTKHGPNIEAEIDCPVEASLSLVWEVLADGDQMTQFITNLEYSGVQHPIVNLLRVRQGARYRKALG